LNVQATGSLEGKYFSHTNARDKAKIYKKMA